jgi:hypothetical protein
MSIRNKLILLILALLTAISAVTGLLFLHSEWSSISANSQRKNLQILLAMTEVCEEAHGAPEKSAAYKYFQTFLKTPEIIGVSCTDTSGHVFMQDKYYSPYPSPFPLPFFFKTFSPPVTGTWET